MEREGLTQGQKELVKFFDSQIATLRALKTPEAIIDEIMWFRPYVLQEAWELYQKGLFFKENYVPFLPVIPLSHRGIHDLVAMITTDKGPGRSSLRSPHLKNARTFVSVYFIFDVDDGQSNLAPNFEEARQSVETAGRDMLSIDEVIALCVHKPSLATPEKLLLLFAGLTNLGIDSEDPVPSVWCRNDMPAMVTHTFKKDFKLEELVHCVLPSKERTF